MGEEKERKDQAEVVKMREIQITRVGYLPKTRAHLLVSSFEVGQQTTQKYTQARVKKKKEGKRS